MEMGRKEQEGGGEAGSGLSFPWKWLGYGTGLAMGHRATSWARGKVPWEPLWGHPGARHSSLLPKSRWVVRLAAGQRGPGARERGCHGTAWPQPRRGEVLYLSQDREEQSRARWAEQGMEGVSPGVCTPQHHRNPGLGYR